MVRFFLPLIIILFIAWLIVGLQQEAEKYKEEFDEWEEIKKEETLETNLYYKWYDSLLQYSSYYNYSLQEKNGIKLLLPKSFIRYTNLVDDANAILQYSSDSLGLVAFVYSEPLSENSTEYTSSKTTYCNALLDVMRNNLKKIHITDSTVVDIYPNYDGIKIQLLGFKINDNGKFDTLGISFVTMQNNKNIYMVYIQGSAQDLIKYRSDVSNIFSSIALVDE